MPAQIKIGNKTEKDIAQYFKSKGFWVHRMPVTANGQSVDIIAVRGDFFMIFDAKHIRKEDISFTFGRTEANQETSMDYMKNFAKIPSERLGFVLYFERIDKYKFLPFDTYLELKSKNIKSVNAHDNELFDLDDKLK